MEALGPRDVYDTLKEVGRTAQSKSVSNGPQWLSVKVTEL